MKYRYKKTRSLAIRKGKSKVGFFTGTRSLKDLKESRRFFMDYFYKLRKIKSRFKKLKPMPVCDDLFWRLAYKPKDRVGKRPIKLLHNYLKTEQHCKRKCYLIRRNRLPYHVLIDTIYHNDQWDVISCAIDKLGHSGIKITDSQIKCLAKKFKYSLCDIFMSFKLSKSMINELFEYSLILLKRALKNDDKDYGDPIYWYTDSLEAAIEFKGDLVNEDLILEAFDIFPDYDLYGIIGAFGVSNVPLSLIEKMFADWCENVEEIKHFTPESCIKEGDEIEKNGDGKFYWELYNLAKIIIKRKGKKNENNYFR